MILFNQIAAAFVLVSLTLCLQVVGVVALIEWLKRVLTRDNHNFGPVHAAALVVKSSVAVIVLHGIVILLWAGWYRCVAFRRGNFPFTSLRAITPQSDVRMSYFRLIGDS